MPCSKSRPMERSKAGANIMTRETCSGRSASRPMNGQPYWPPEPWANSDVSHSIDRRGKVITADNKDLVRRWLDELNHGSGQDIFALMAVDFEITEMDRHS